MIVYTDDTVIHIQPTDAGVEIRMASGLNLMTTTFNYDQYRHLLQVLAVYADEQDKPRTVRLPEPPAASYSDFGG